MRNNLFRHALTASLAVMTAMAVPVTVFAEDPTAKVPGIDTADGQQYNGNSDGTGAWGNSATESAGTDTINDHKENTYDGKVHLFYDTNGGHWQDPGQNTADAADNNGHPNGTYLVTIPTKIAYVNMNVGKVNTSDNYTVNVRGAIADGNVITVTAENGKTLSNGTFTDITETTTQGKTDWTSAEVYNGLNEDGSVKGTDCTDNIKMTGEVKTAGTYEGSVLYSANMLTKQEAAHKATALAKYNAPSNIAKGTSGTCWWWINSENALHIAPIEGAKSGTLGEPDMYRWPEMPWVDFLGEHEGYQDIITSVTVEPGVIANAESETLFYGLVNATSIDVKNLDTSNVKNMNNMFGDCESLTSIDLTSFNTSNVLYMSAMFKYCSGLTSLDITSFDTSNVTNTLDIFNDCTSLTNFRTGTLWKDTNGQNSPAKFPVAMRDENGKIYTANEIIPGGAHTYTKA